MLNTFDASVREKLTTDNKIGLIAMLDKDGTPHVVFINTLMALDENTLAWGQFIQGFSKRLLPESKNAAFLALTPQMELWRGKAVYDHCEKSGDVFELFNNKPLFRYNSYFGIESAHLMKLQSITETEKLSMADIAAGAVLSRAAAPFARGKDERGAMNAATMSLYKQLAGLKFIAYEDSDGFPWIVPCIQAAPAGRDKLVFSSHPYGGELTTIPKGARVAVFFASMQMQNVMVKGVFEGFERRGGVKAGVVGIDLVYNPMPPESNVIYPREPLVAVDVK